MLVLRALKLHLFLETLLLTQKGYQTFIYIVLCQHLQVTQATNQIVMNCADIDIITASFVPQGGEGEDQTLSAFHPVSSCINDITVQYKKI